MMTINPDYKSFTGSITRAEVDFFCTPHIVVDDIFPSNILEEINNNWPSTGFTPEVKGNNVFQIKKKEYSCIENIDFWRPFNEEVWPLMMASLAKKFEPFGEHIFGSLYKSDLSLCHPLTLMEANTEFNGHDMHTHFYHAPHWAFTVLVYVDPIDQLSNGTTLHALKPISANTSDGTPFQAEEISRRTEVAFDTFRWLDPTRPERQYRDKEIDYKGNRLFAFFDGPMALHSVKTTMSGKQVETDLRKNNEISRRRILRAHVKVHHDPFYKQISTICKSKIAPEMFMKCMAPGVQLDATEQAFKDQSLKKMYSFSINRYSLFDSSNTQLSKLESPKLSFYERTKKFLKHIFFAHSESYLDNFKNNIP